MVMTRMTRRRSETSSLVKLAGFREKVFQIKVLLPSRRSSGTNANKLASGEAFKKSTFLGKSMLY